MLQDTSILWALFTDHINLCHFSFIWSPPHQQCCSCLLLELKSNQQCSVLLLVKSVTFTATMKSSFSEDYPSYNYNVWLQVETKCDLLFCRKNCTLCIGYVALLQKNKFALVLVNTSASCSQPKQSFFDIWFTACDNIVWCVLTFFMFWNLLLTQSMLKLAVFAVVELWLWQIYRRALVDVLEWGLRTGPQHRHVPQCRFAITSSRSIFGKPAKLCCVSQVEFKALISLLPLHRVAEKGP